MRLFITVLSCSLSLIVFGQTNSEAVISSSGVTLQSSQNILDFTIGETVIESFVNDFTLTQGFHQSEITITDISHHKLDFNISIYPNPSTNYLNIDFSHLGTLPVYLI